MTTTLTLVAELLALAGETVGGEWECIASTEHHGPYVCSEFGSTIADLYTMTLPNERSTANGGSSKPVNFLHEMADPNAAYIAKANPMNITALCLAVKELSEENARVREALIKVAVVGHVRATHGDAWVDNGKSCRICKSECGRGEKLIHTPGCALAAGEKT